MSDEEQIVANLSPFGDDALTVAALRSLAFIGIRAAERALADRDYEQAQRAMFAALETTAFLEKRESSNG